MRKHPVQETRRPVALVDPEIIPSRRMSTRIGGRGNIYSGRSGLPKGVQNTGSAGAQTGTFLNFKPRPALAEPNVVQSKFIGRTNRTLIYAVNKYVAGCGVPVGAPRGSIPRNGINISRTGLPAA